MTDKLSIRQYFILFVKYILFHMELPNFKITKLQLEQLLYLLLVISLFFPLREVFSTNSAYQTGAYSDFTSFSLYLSDIIIFCLILLNWKSIWQKSRGVHVIFAYLTWILLFFILKWAGLVSLNFYFFARFIGLILFYWLTVASPVPLKSWVSWFIGLSAIQSLLALVQFISQKSVGLYLLGESHLDPNLAGVAKIVSHGTKFIRGYGTFPHSNLLSAFLMTAILISLYKIFTSSTRRQKILFSSLLIVNIFGLTVTFSRAGIGATILVTVIFLTELAISRGVRKKLLWVAAVTGIAFLAAFASFNQFLFTRATLTDNAVKERAFYNEIGTRIVAAHPIGGIGFGTSVLHMQQFTDQKLEPWQIQPVHNYYLLAAAEIGLVGAGLWIIVLLWHLVKLLRPLIKNRQWRTDESVYRLTLGLILFGFMILMLFDHYFYTINQTQLLLWLILGLIGGEARRQEASA